MRPLLELSRNVLGLILGSAVALGVGGVDRASADLVIHQEVQNEGLTAPQGQAVPAGDMKITMSIKGSSARIDMAGQPSMIIDGTTGNLTTILHAQKMYMVMSGEQLGEAMKMAAAMRGVPEKPGTPAPTSKLEPTGKSAQISGYKAEEYIQKLPDGDCHYWIAKDYPKYKDILKQMSVFQDSSLGKMAADAGLPKMDHNSLPGMPLKTVMEMAKGGKVTVTMVSLEDKPVDAALFEKPADYSEMKMPAMPGMPVQP